MTDIQNGIETYAQPLDKSYKVPCNLFGNKSTVYLRDLNGSELEIYLEQLNTEIRRVFNGND